MEEYPKKSTSLLNNPKLLIGAALFIVLVLVIVFVFSDGLTTTDSNISEDRSNVNIAADEAAGLKKIVSVDIAVADATNLTDDPICLTGFYERQGDVTILGSTFTEGADGVKHADTDGAVWVPVDEVLYSTITCNDDGDACFGPIQACGKFKIADGENGFGPDSDIMYALELPSTGIKGCVEDTDCGINSCTECYNKNYLNDPYLKEDPECSAQEEYTCICVNRTCTEINFKDLGLFGR